MVHQRDGVLLADHRQVRLLLQPHDAVRPRPPVTQKCELCNDIVSLDETTTTNNTDWWMFHVAYATQHKRVVIRPTYRIVLHRHYDCTGFQAQLQLLLRKSKHFFCKSGWTHARAKILAGFAKCHCTVLHKLHLKLVLKHFVQHFNGFLSFTSHALLGCQEWYFNLLI